ncbi:MAG: hypothetical protein MUC53_00105 [Candidatus Contendobacter sp.]|jgi:hypothetical protein|nr:hypothetical protein [Candidatus Contendobacter sp.]
MAVAVASKALYLNCAIKFGFWSGDTPPTQFYDAVNWTKLELTSQVQESDDLLSNMEGSAGELLASVNKTTEAGSLSAEADYMPPALYSVLLGATLTEVTQSATTVTKEAIGAQTLGLWTPLDHQYVLPSATGQAIIAYTATDATIGASHYTVDLINGLYKPLTATGATATQLTYKYGTRTIENYAAGKAISNYVMLIGSATEKVSSKRGRIVVAKVNLAGSAAFDPVTGTYVKGSFAGKMLTPTGYTSPWTFQVSDLAA